MKAKEENEIIDFNQVGYDSTVSTLKLFAKQINERPVEDDDPLAVNSLRRSGIINESFRSLCIKLGLTPSLDFFKRVHNANAQGAERIIRDEIEASLKSQNILEVILPSIMEVNDPLIKQLAHIVQVLYSSYSRHLHSVWTTTQKTIDLMDYLSFGDGFAIVPDEALNTLKEEFTIRVDSPLKKEIFDLLSAVSDSINRFNEANQKHGLNLSQMQIDQNYFSYENDNVVLIASTLKFI